MESKMNEQKRYILCMKWGQKYGAQYVNRLYSMVKRHLTLPFEMVCLTDNSDGIDPAIACYPIPPLDLPQGAPERGWNKLSTFAADLYGLQGQALFLDLDVVIVGNMDDFFTVEGAFCVIHDWKRPWRITGNTSVYRFTIGAFPDVLPYFRAHYADIVRRFRNEQAYLSWFIDKHYQQLRYWPKAWCKSYKYHCLRPLPFALWQPPVLPDDAKIIIFHGEINPPDAIVGRGGKWYRHVLPSTWIAEHWQ